VGGRVYQEKESRLNDKGQRGGESLKFRKKGKDDSSVLKDGRERCCRAFERLKACQAKNFRGKPEKGMAHPTGK